MIRGGWRGLAALTRLALSAPELDARSTRGAKDRDRAPLAVSAWNGDGEYSPAC